MQWAKASAFMFIKDEDKEAFEKEFDLLIQKYADKTVNNSSNKVEFGKVFEIEDDGKRYKAGQIYRVTACQIPTWLVLMKVTDTIAIGSLVIEKKKLSYVMRSSNGSYNTILLPNKNFMKINTENGNLMYNVGFRKGGALCPDSYVPIDEYLEYYGILRPNIINNISRILEGKEELPM